MKYKKLAIILWETYACKICKYKMTLACGIAFLSILLSWLLLSGSGYNDINDNVIKDNLDSDKVLRQVIIVFRHGQRSPAKVFSYDKYKDGKHWPEGLGHLTNVGKMQLYEMGKRIRDRYGKLITPYSKDPLRDIWSVTTNYERSFQSAALILAGLYPPNKDQAWSDELPWNPMPVFFQSPDKAYILTLGDISCPRYFQELLSVTLSHDAPLRNELIDYFSQHIDIEEVKQRYNLFMLCDAIIAENKMNLPQPDWVDNVLLDKMNKYIAYVFAQTTSNLVMKRLLSGTLITDVISSMNKVVNKEEYSKTHLYSGHDSSVHGLMRLFDYQGDLVPDYGSSVIFELFQSLSSQNYYVKIIYNTNVSFSDLTTYKLPSCDILCPLDQFAKIMEPFQVSDWDKECKLEETDLIV